jgi:hypothetical protein
VEAWRRVTPNGSFTRGPAVVPRCFSSPSLSSVSDPSSGWLTAGRAGCPELCGRAYEFGRGRGGNRAIRRRSVRGGRSSSQRARRPQGADRRDRVRSGGSETAISSSRDRRGAGLYGHTSARGGGLAVAVGRRTASVAWVSSTAKRSQSPRAACAGSDRAYPAQRGRRVDRPCARCFAWGRLASRRWRRTFRALRRCRSKGVQSWC